MIGHKVFRHEGSRRRSDQAEVVHAVLGLPHGMSLPSAVLRKIGPKCVAQKTHTADVQSGKMRTHHRMTARKKTRL